jgi:hypothetical protein
MMVLPAVKRLDDRAAEAVRAPADLPEGTSVDAVVEAPRAR